MRPSAFWTRLFQSLTVRPSAFVQVGAAFAITFLLTIQFYNHWQSSQVAATVKPVAPTIVAAASERPVQVIYDDARANDRREETVDSAVMLLPAFESQPRVQFVMDRVDITPKVYAASFNY